MRFNEIKSSHFNLADVAKLASTQAFRCKVDKALNIIEQFMQITKRPAVSFGGGKDSTAVLILAQMIDPSITVVCADPPNPLSGRAEHIENVIRTCQPQILRTSYNWDVEAVLKGQKPYPEKLKMQALKILQEQNHIDGIIWGCRTSESRGRLYNFAQNGYIYRVSDGTYRCQPIAKWSAEDVLALACVTGYPINPVYEKMDGFYNLDNIHDGTWWCHDGYMGEKEGWIKRYFPEHYEDYLRATKVWGSHKYTDCQF